MIPWFLCLLVTQALGDTILDNRAPTSSCATAASGDNVCPTLALAVAQTSHVFIHTPQTLTTAQFTYSFSSAATMTIGQKISATSPEVVLDAKAITVSDASVDLKVYSLNVQVTHISSQFLFISDGVAGLQSIDFSVKQTHARLAQPLISATGGVLTIDTCTFTGIKATRGKGTCIYDETNALTVKGTTFTGCYGNTDSAAVYIKIDDTKAFETSIVGTFTGNKAGYSSAVDRDVYVEATGALDKLVQKTSNLGSGTLVIVDNGDVVTATNINTAAGTGASDSPVIVGPTSYTTNCGSQYVPCSTVSDAAALLSATTIYVELLAHDSYTVAAVSPSVDESVTSLYVRGPQTVGQSANVALTGTTAVFTLSSSTNKGLSVFQVKDIKFTLDSDITPLLDSSIACAITLTNVEFATSQDITYGTGVSPIMVTAGSLKLDSCHIHGSSSKVITMTDTPLLILTGSDGYAVQFECVNTLFAYITARTNTATVIGTKLNPGRVFSISTTATAGEYPPTFDTASGSSAATSAIVLDAREITTGTNWDQVTFDHVDFGESAYYCMSLELSSSHNLDKRENHWTILRSQLKKCAVTGVPGITSLAQMYDIFGSDSITVTSETADCLSPGTYSVKQFKCNSLSDASSIIGSTAFVQDNTITVASGISSAAAITMNGIGVKRTISGGANQNTIALNGNLFGSITASLSVDHFTFTISSSTDKFGTFNDGSGDLTLSYVTFSQSSSTIKLSDPLITISNAETVVLDHLTFSNIQSTANGACMAIASSNVSPFSLTSSSQSGCSTDGYGNYIAFTGTTIAKWAQELIDADQSGTNIVYVDSNGKRQLPWFTSTITIDDSTSPCYGSTCATIAEALLSEQYVTDKYRQIKLPASAITTQSIDISSASYLYVSKASYSSDNMEVTIDQRKPLFVTGSNTLGVEGLKYSIGVSGSETEIIVKFIDMTAGEAQFTSVEVAGVTGSGSSVTIPNDFITIAGGKVTLDTCTFSNLIIKEGYYFLKQTSGTVSIVGSTFSGITMGDKPLMTMTSYNVFNEEGSVNTFSSIQRLSGNGAVFEIIDSSAVNHKWSKVKFENCWCGPASKASDYDDENELLFGAVYIYLTGNGLVSFELSAASRCAVNSKPSNIIYLKGSTRSDIKPFQFFPLLRSIKAAPIDESNAVMVEVMGELYSLNELLVSLEVKASSTASEIACDDEVPACGTIAQAISWGSSGMYDKTITVTTPITETIGSTLNYYITIEQDNTARTVTLPASGTLFTVSQANGCDPVINIGTITFSLPASSTCQFAVVNAGSLTITGTKFTSSSTSAMSNSFIDASSGTLALGAGVSFSNIKVESGKPLLKLNPNKHFLASAPSFTGINSVINHQLSAGQVVFQDITLTNCGTANTVNGQGEITAAGTPAICVDITGYTGLSNDVVLFGTVTTTKSPAAALNIEIVCSESQWENVASHIIGSSTTLATPTENQYCLVSIDDNSYTWDKIPTSSPLAYNIKSTGYNIPSCGDTGTECKTVQYVHDSYTSGKTIQLSASPVLADVQATITKPTTIQGVTDTPATVAFTISTAAGTIFTVNSDNAVTIQYMTFSLTANTNMKLLSNSAGTVTVSNIAVTPTKAVTLSSSLISVSSGSLSMTSVSIGHASNAITASALLISLPSTAAVNFVAQGCTFTNIVNGSSINPVLISTSLSAASTFKLVADGSGNACTFAPTATTFAGTYIQLAFAADSIGSNVVLTGLSYTHPGSATGKLLRVSGLSRKTIVSSTWTMDATSGKTGWDHSFLAGTPDVSFTTLTTAPAATETTLYVDAGGNDGYTYGTSPICGASDLPCATIAKALAQMGSSGTTITVSGEQITVGAVSVAKALTIQGTEVTASSGIYPLTEVDTETYFTVTNDVAAGATVTIKQLGIALKGAGVLLSSAALGTVVLQDITVTPTAAVSYGSGTAPVAVTDGSLTLTRVNIGSPDYKITLNDKPLIDTTTVTCSACSFMNIVSGATGAVFTAELAATSVFKLLRTGAGTTASPYVYNTFIDCISTVAAGGAFAIDASAVTDWTNVVIDEIRESGCMSNGVGQVGYIKVAKILAASTDTDSENAGKIAKDAIITFVSGLSAKDYYDSSADYRFFTALNVPETAPITTTVDKLAITQTDIHFHATANLNNAKCGSVEFPCESLTAASTTLPAAGWSSRTVLNLLASTDFTHTDVAMVGSTASSLGVIGVGDGSSVAIGDAVCHVLSGTKTLTLQTHKYTVSNAGARLATVASGCTLNMYGITVDGTGQTLTNTFIEVSNGGILNVKKCTFSSVAVAANKAVISVALPNNGATLSIVGEVPYTGTVGAGDKTSFSGCTCASGDTTAPVVITGSGVTSWSGVRIDDVAFTSCTVNSNPSNMYITGNNALGSLQPTWNLAAADLLLCKTANTGDKESLGALWENKISLQSLEVAKDADVTVGDCTNTAGVGKCKTLNNAIALIGTAGWADGVEHKITIGGTSVTTVAKIGGTVGVSVDIGPASDVTLTDAVGDGATVFTIQNTAVDVGISKLIANLAQNNKFLVSAATGTTSLTSIKLTIETAAKSFSAPLISVTAGTLSLNTVTIGDASLDMTFSGSGVVSLSDGVSFDCIDTKFQHIIISHASSSVISSKLSSTSHFYISSSARPLPLATSRANGDTLSNNFDSITTTSANGPVFLDITDATSVDQVTINNVKFLACLYDTDKPRYLTIKSTVSQLESITANQKGTTNKWETKTDSEGSTVVDTENVIVNVYDSSTLKATLPLKAIGETYTVAGTYVVDKDGYDFVTCGETTSCKTVAYAATLPVADPSTDPTVTVNIAYSSTVHVTSTLAANLASSVVEPSGTKLVITGLPDGGSGTTYPNVKLDATCFIINILDLHVEVNTLNFYIAGTAAQLAVVQQGQLTLTTVTSTQYPSDTTGAPTGITAQSTINKPLIKVENTGDLILSSCTFTGITSTTVSGSVIDATLTGTATFKIVGDYDSGNSVYTGTHPTSFATCKGAAPGGPIKIDISGVTASTGLSNFQLLAPTFTSCVAGTDTAQDIAFVATGRLTELAGLTTTDSIANTEYSKCPVTGTDIESGLTLEHLWTAQAATATTVYVKATGADTENSTPVTTCGWDKNPCQSLITAFAQCTATSSCNTITVGTGTYTPTVPASTTTIGKTITATGTAPTNINVPTLSAALFTIDGSSITATFSTLVFIAHSYTVSTSGDNALSNSLFVLTQGTLALATVTIKMAPVEAPNSASEITASMITAAFGTTLNLNGVVIGDGTTLVEIYDKSIIDIAQGANFECVGSTFQKIRVTESTPLHSVIQATLTTGTTFTLSNTPAGGVAGSGNTFTNIVTPSTGAVCLDISTVDANAVKISSNTFTSCKAGTVERCMYVKVTDTQLSTGLVALTTLMDTWSVDTYKSKIIIAAYNSGTLVTNIPLDAFAAVTGAEFLVADNGYDYATCGTSAMECLTIGKAVSQGGAATTIKVKLTDGDEYTTTNILYDTSSSPATLTTLNIEGVTSTGASGNTIKPSVSLQGTCLTVNKAEVSVTLKDIIFTADAAAAVLASVTQLKLTMTAIDVTQSTSSLSNPLISVAATGKLEIVSCTFTEIVSSTVAGVVITTATLTEKGCEVKITGTDNAPTEFALCKGAASGGAIVLDCSAVEKVIDGTTVYISMDHVQFLGCYSSTTKQNMLIKLGVLDDTLKAEIVKGTWNFIEQDLPAWTGKYAMTYKDDASTAHTNPEPFTELIGPVTMATIDFTVATPLARCGGSLNPCNKVQGVVTNYASTLQTITVPVKKDASDKDTDWAFADIQLTDTAIGAFKSDLTVTFAQISTTDEETSTTTYSNSGVSATGTLFTWNSKTKLSASHLDVTLSGTDAQVATVTDGSLLLREMSIKQTAAGATATEITNAIHKFEELSYTNALKKSVIEVAGGCDLDLDSTVKFSGIYSAADGGCLNIVYDSSMQNIKADASFSRCMTNGKGGILYLDLSAIPDEVIGEIVFGEGIDREEQYYAYNGGDYVALNPSSYTAEALGNIFTTFVNLEKLPGQCVFSGNQTDLAIQANSYTVKANGGDETSITNAIDAGQEEDKQFSLYSIKVEADLDIGGMAPTKSVKISGTNTLTLKAGPTVFSITELTQVGIALNVESLTIKRQTDVNYGGLLDMEKASYVTFNKMTYDCSGASKSSTVSAIIASSGVVTVIGSTFKSVSSVKTFVNVPLANFYSLLSGTTKNTFDSISSSNTNGTIFNLAASSITLENMEFISCTAEEGASVGSGCGGVAYITTSGTTTFEFINIAMTAGSAKDGDVFFISVNDEKDIKYSDFIDLLSSNNLQASTIKYQKGTDASVAISGRVVTAELKVDSSKSFLDTLTASDSKFTTDSATAVTIPSGTFKESADAITLDRSVTISGASASDTTIPFTGKDTAFKISGGKAGKIVTVVLKSITLSYYGSTSSRSNDAAQVGSMVSVAQYTTAELNSITIKPDDNHNNIILTSSCITSDGNLILTDMTIQDLTLQDKSLIYIKDVTKDTFKLTNTNTFTNIVKKEGDGAILSVTLATTSELVITNVTFDSCEASNGNGGVLSITQNGGKLTLKSVTFNNCNAKTTTSTYSSTISSTLRTNAEGDTSSDNTPSTPTSSEKYDTGCGGCLYVSHSADGTHDLSDLTIKGGSASGFGSVLFITGSISSAILKQYKTLLLQAQGSKQCMYFGADKQTQALDLSNLVPSTIYVDAEGTKTETCEKSSESTKACDLLSSAIQSYYGLGKGIQIAAGTYVDTAVYGLPLNRQMSIVGETGTIINITASRTSDDVRSVYIVNPSSDATISFESITFNVITPSSSVGSVFSLASTATLALTYVQLIGDGGLMEDSVIRANAGKVDLTGCTIKSFETYSDALIYSYRPTITLNAGNTFDSISRRSGNGAVFEFEMTKGDSFTLIGSKFTKCASKDGRGGAIYIAYDGGHLVIGDEKETKKDEITTIFEGCSAGSSSASNTRVNSGLTNDDAGKTSEDFEDNLPTSGAGGALYVDIYDIDTNTYNFNITSVKFTDCTATKEGNAVYLRAHTEAGTTMLKDKAFWKTMLKMNKASGDFVYADYTNKSKTAPKSPNLLGLWLGLGLGLGLLAIAGVVITIVCCMRKKKISPSEDKKSTEMSPV